MSRPPAPLPRRPAPIGLIALVCVLLGACAGPRIVEPLPDTLEPRLTPAASPEFARMPDGYRLPLRVWPGADPGGQSPGIIVIGLHGFNDYAHAFEPLAQSLAAAGITTYAIDQRGFGATRLAGHWHGSNRLVSDLRALTRLLHRRFPDARIYLIGESMGGAVVIDAVTRGPLPIAGAALIAPAVWSRDEMPWYQRLGLDTLARIAPGMELTGEGVTIRPSDNIEMLRAMRHDPLVIKATRVEALWGVTNLMDSAMAAVPRLSGPLLLLYGEKDEIIPKSAFCRMLDRLPASGPGGGADIRLVLYRQGWHMLPRDLHGERVRADLIAWLEDTRAPLPSGEESPPGSPRTRGFCAAPSTMAR
jgi:alpha-beta hydrolase superfamily lysophospholipase